MTFDTLVVGQGLAGTAVGWRLRWAGQRVLVVDRGDDATASRVAAGLVTPVTGRRLAKTWLLDEAFPAAVAFYRRVEAETGERVFVQREMVRLFADEAERAAFQARASGSLRDSVGPLTLGLDPGCVAAPHGGFAMAPAGRLGVTRYLDASRAAFARDGGFRIADLAAGRDFAITPDGVSVPRLGVDAARVVFCQGLAAGDHPWCGGVRFTPVKGEILTLRVPGWREERVVHRGVWLAPQGGDVVLCGATYDRDDLTPAPTARGRDHLLGRLGEFLRLPVEVIGHRAGVRPVAAGGKPVFGRHPGHPRLAYLNGLGSKGALLAPLFAARLAALFDSTAEQPGSPPRAVDVAHAAVRAVLRPGEVAIDATAGGGRDTAFLAGLVGPAGRVLALDLQPLALERTSALLTARGLTNVTLVREDHSALAGVVPAEWRGRVGAAMFHLGRLPGGDRSTAPAPGGTPAALRAAISLLRPGGILTLVTRPAAEVGRGVREVLSAAGAAGFVVRERGGDGRSHSGPRVFVVARPI